jgi:hypothetical protein
MVQGIFSTRDRRDQNRIGRLPSVPIGAGTPPSASIVQTGPSLPSAAETGRLWLRSDDDDDLVAVRVDACDHAHRCDPAVMDGTNARPLEFVDLCSPRAVRAGRGSSDGDRMRLRDPHRRSDPLMNLCVRPDTSRSHHRGTPRQVDSGHALDRRDRDIVAHDDAVPPPGYCSDALDSRPSGENQRGRHRDDHQQDHSESAQRNPHRLEVASCRSQIRHARDDHVSLGHGAHRSEGAPSPRAAGVRPCCQLRGRRAIRTVFPEFAVSARSSTAAGPHRPRSSPVGTSAHEYQSSRTGHQWSSSSVRA